MRAVWALILLAVTTGCQAAEPPQLRNLALGCGYKLDPAPNYALCKDAGDALQVTDGQYVSGYFWVQPGCVGWGHGRPIIATIDLGQTQPIAGVSFSTAAGRAGVAWPSGLLVYVSDDARSWWYVDDLVTLSARHDLPPADYGTHRFWTDQLQTSGRYVAVVGAPGTNYFFVDEIEVWEGPAALRDAPRQGVPVGDLKASFNEKMATVTVRGRVVAGATGLKERLRAANLPVAELRRWLDEVDTAVREADQPLSVGPGFRAIVPFSAAQRRLYRAQAALWRAAGRPPCQVWSGHRYEPLRVDSLPANTAPPALRVSLLRDEVRGATLNVTNAQDHDQVVTLHADGLPGGALPAWLTVRDAVWTATAAGGEVAAALPEAQRTATGWTTTVPSGLTCQLWLEVDAHRLAAGTHRGHLVVSAAEPSRVPFEIRVSPIAMPADPRLTLGGWDYTDAVGRGVTDANLDALVAFLRRYHVNSPWATGAVMPFGQHDATGQMTAPPSTARLDAWLDRWAGARYYAVFNAFSTALPDTPAARAKVKAWIDFWVAHLKSKGVAARQLRLLLFDEPHSPEGDAVIRTYGEVIRAAQPEVQIFTDPTWTDPRQADPRMLDVNSVLCPNRPMWIANRANYEEVFLKRLAGGQTLAFYSCWGPVRDLDPSSYHRLQAWDCFRYGATEMYYWAFSDSGGGDSWNEFAAPGRVFCPQFLGPDSVVTAKHMEAIRDGVYDYETLCLLRDAAARARDANRLPDVVAAAEKLLEEGPRRVLTGPGLDSIQWSDAKDRDAADQVRDEAIGLLEKLAG